jgi:hypothetical protein
MQKKETGGLFTGREDHLNANQKNHKSQEAETTQAHRKGLRKDWHYLNEHDIHLKKSICMTCLIDKPNMSWGTLKMPHLGLDRHDTHSRTSLAWEKKSMFGTILRSICIATSTFWKDMVVETFAIVTGRIWRISFNPNGDSWMYMLSIR